MSTALIVDIEKLASAYLREHVASRVVGKTPSNTDTGWVRVTLLTAPTPADSKIDHHVANMVQFDCYAGKDGGQPEANLIARTVRAALMEMGEEDFDDAVVGAVRILSHIRRPDTDGFDPARERVEITADIYVHPKPEGS